MSETTKLILLDSLLQKVVATLPHLLMQRKINQDHGSNNWESTAKKEISQESEQLNT
jgi:hypothetical protein